MIAYIQGKIKSISQKTVIVLTGGIGYEIHTTASIVSDAVVGDECSFEIATVIKEDAFDLYGFATTAQKRMFQLLLTISGVGPKSALGVLDVASVEDITEAVLSQEPQLLETVSGIGKKTAARIVLELKNKIAGATLETLSRKSSGDVEVLQALQALGYELSEVRAVVRSLDTTLSTEEKITQTLRVLGS